MMKKQNVLPTLTYEIDTVSPDRYHVQTQEAEPRIIARCTTWQNAVLVMVALNQQQLVGQYKARLAEIRALVQRAV